MRKTIDVKACVHCHRCRDNCDFLSSYGIDIGDVESLREKAFHCFMCGRCTEVCPIGIDGREVILGLRRDIAGEKPKDAERAYKGLIREKKDYRFRNYRKAAGKTIFFPGCNLPSLYPKTVRRLESIFEEHGIGTAYDCCGKPIAELGFASDEVRIIDGINRRLSELGAEELVVGCPNCRSFLNGRLDMKIVGVYEKLHELGACEMIDGDISVYIPCPDREGRIWLDELKPLVRGSIRAVDSVQCCGLGGSAARLEPELAKGFSKAIREEFSGERVFCYCASCAGQLMRNGVQDVTHILAELLGTGEKADTGKSYINRMMTRFK